MKSVLVRYGWFVGGICFALCDGILLAGPADVPDASTKLPVEQQWQQLQIAKTPWNSGPLFANKTVSEQKVLRDQEATAYVAAADRFKSFYVGNPASSHAGEAKRLEAMNLMYAAINGNNAYEGRWQGLVAEVRRDANLPEADRFAAASLGDSLAVRRKYKSREEHLAAYENVARSLIAEFPNQRGGYESLLGVARSASAEKGVELCHALLQLAAPDDIKNEASHLAKRYALVGQPVAPLIQNSGAKLALNAGTPLIIYGWASWSSGSQDLAKILQTKAGAAVLVGVCLDTDVDAAKAAGKDLPGTQFFDDRGQEGALAQALQLSDAGWVYLVDHTGVIRSVRGQDNLSLISSL